MNDITGDAIGLDALERRLRQDLAWLDYPAKSWVPERRVNGQLVRDVVIVGAGMAGLAASAMLARLGVSNHVVYDRAPAGREGPWITSARMRTLRSPKQLAGPALGLPALTFRAWYEARCGIAAWEALGRIPRALWMEYLVWYRRVLALPVENEADLTRVRAGAEGLLELTIAQNGKSNTVLARHLVLATGRDGLGGPFSPPFVEGLPRRFWAHSADDIDFAALAGKRVGVIGGSASAFDNAATALETGAARVDLFVRRPDIPRIHKYNGISSQGVVHGFAGLPDAWKWRFYFYVLATQTPPPRDSTLRVSRHANAFFHVGSPIRAVTVAGDHLHIATPKGGYEVDFLICATGFGVDLARRPELADFADKIRFWRDRFTPPDDPDSAAPIPEEMATAPDLGESFEFQEKIAGTCPALARIHCFNFAGTLSHGKLTGDIPAISDGADRLARGIISSLFVADFEQHYARMEEFSTPELLGDEWRDADAPGGESD